MLRKIPTPLQLLIFAVLGFGTAVLVKRLVTDQDLLQKPKILQSSEKNEPATPASPSSVSTTIHTVENEELKKAVQLRDSGQLAEAEKILKEILAKEPENILAIRELVTIYHTGRPNYPEALRLEEKLLLVETMKTQEFDRYRELARLGKSQDRAITFLEQMEPAHPAIAFMIPKTIGQLYAEKGDHTKAIEKFRESLILPNDRTAPIHELIATSQLKQKNYKDAQSSLEQVIEDANEYNKKEGRNVKEQISTRDAELQLIDVYLNNGQYQKAMTLTNDLLKTDSQNKDLQKFQEMAKMGLNQGKQISNQ